MNVSRFLTIASLGSTTWAADPIKLNGPLVTGGDVSSNGLQFSPDSSRVLYLADQDTDNVFEIYSVSSGGGTPTKLNGPLVAGGNVSFFGGQFSPDGSKVLYLADQDTDGVIEAYVRIVRDRANPGGGDWDIAANWDQGVAPDEVMQVFIDAPAVVTATGNTTARSVNELTLGGGAGTSVLDLEESAVITAIHGISIQPGGVLRGTGIVVGDVTVSNGGEIRAGVGDQLQIGGAAFVNAGRVEAIGTTFAPAEIEFSDTVLNNTGTGLIAGENATFRFNDGLTSLGAMAFSFGTSRVFGDVSNLSSGNVIVSGNSNVTFYDDVDNSATMNVSAGSTAVFFGELSGSGVGGAGTVFLEGDMRPGASPGTMEFGGDVHFGPFSMLEIELGGTSVDDFDTLDITGAATLAGTLDVQLITTPDGTFMPEAGYSFEILTANGGLGDTTFDEELLPALTDDLEWKVTYSSTSVVLEILTPYLDADFDENGDVDGADFLTWQLGFGITTGATRADGDATGEGAVNADDLVIWQSQYGSAVSAAAGSSAVPEPATWILATALFILVAIARYRQGVPT